jgi:hypothetical protein
VFENEEHVLCNCPGYFAYIMNDLYDAAAVTKILKTVILKT